MVKPVYGIHIIQWHKERTTETHKLEGSLGNYAVLKKPVSKGYIMYDPICMIFLKWQNYGDGKEISGYQGLERGEGGELLWLLKGFLWQNCAVVDNGGSHKNLHVIELH